MTSTEIKTRLLEKLTRAQVEVRDLTGTADHYEAVIVTPDFEGLKLVARHQLVYEIFREELATGELHAFSLKTLTPAEASEKVLMEERYERRGT